jgi:hypothetical protein
LVWNYLGYHGEQTINWSCIVSDLQGMDKKVLRAIRVSQIGHYKKHLYTNVTTICFVVLASVLVLFSPYLLEAAFPHAATGTEVAGEQATAFETAKEGKADAPKTEAAEGARVLSDIQTQYLFLSLFVIMIMLYTRQIYTHFYARKGRRFICR